MKPRPILLILLSAFVGAALPASAGAQTSLKASLEKLDVNKNKYIEPHEITSLARPYLERISRGSRGRGGFSIERGAYVQDIVDAAQRYYSASNGSNGRDVRPRIETKLKSFGVEDKKPLVPGFGVARMRYPYIREDMAEADRTMGRCDDNDDGFIDRKEALQNRWTHRDPFADDLDKDGRLSHMELTQRYARRRLLDDRGDEIRDRREIERQAERSKKYSRSRSGERTQQWWEKGGTKTWLSASLLGRFDKNRNGKLEFEEAAALGIPPGKMDVDSSGDVSRDELMAYIAMMQDEVGDMTEGLPDWFYELDHNDDGQVALAEFAEAKRPFSEFQKLDMNDDGFLTHREAVLSKAVVGGRFRNNEAEIIPPRRTMVSEIVVEDDFKIGDLNVELAITHSQISMLDGFLTGPSGETIELFTAVGGSGDNMSKTVFDDQSKLPITKAKPPYEGSYMPEGLAKKQPGLAKFNGESIKGTWKLELRCGRNDRFGMLHSWGISASADGKILSGSSDSAAADDKTKESKAAPSPSSGKRPPATSATNSKPTPTKKTDDKNQDEQRELKAKLKELKERRKLSGKSDKKNSKDDDRGTSKKKKAAKSTGSSLLKSILDF